MDSTLTVKSSKKKKNFRSNQNRGKICKIQKNKDKDETRLLVTNNVSQNIMETRFIALNVKNSYQAKILYLEKISFKSRHEIHFIPHTTADRVHQ